MAYSNEEKAMALSLWLAGKSYRDIEEATKINTNTLMKWNEAYGWDNLKEEHLQRLNEAASNTVTDFKDKMLKQLEKLCDELISDFSMAKTATKDKIVSNILEINKQMFLLNGLPVDISKVNQHVEVKQQMKLEDYFK